MQLDVRRFFYRIDRLRLQHQLFRHWPEPWLRALLREILDSGAGLYRKKAVVQWLGWDTPNEQARGLPIGNLTSQWWGNVVLDALDHYVQRHLRVGAYQRYMDDITLFDRNPDRLVRHRGKVAAWLAAHRGLELKDRLAPPISTHQPSVYLGYRVSRHLLELAPKARSRLRGHVDRHVRNPERLRASMAAFGAAWMFGQR